MEKITPDWEDWNRGEYSIFDAACLLCNIEPFDPQINKRFPRYSEWLNHRRKVLRAKEALIDSGIFKEKERVNLKRTSPQTSYSFTTDPLLDGWGNKQSKYKGITITETTIENIKYIELVDLIKFAHEKKYNTAYKELTREPAETDLHPKVKTTLYKMILGLAVKHYGYKPGETEQRATGKKTTKGASGNDNSIAYDLDKMGLDITDDPIRKRLKEAEEHLIQKGEEKKFLKDLLK